MLAAENGVEVDSGSLRKGQFSQEINEVKRIDTKNANGATSEFARDVCIWTALRRQS
jgi:hypothetical protein